MIGLRNGRLEVIGIFYKQNSKGRKIKYYQCKCSCGKEKLIRADGIRNGSIKSCGCLLKELASQRAKKMGEANKKHGMSRSRIYKIWDGMRERCNNPNSSGFSKYGGRGITYDPKWEIFENFYSDMAEGYAENLTIERIDVNGNYTKDNCCWVLMETQQANKQNTIYLTLNGETKRLVEWATILNISPHTLRTRKRLGWTDFDTLTKPIR